MASTGRCVMSSPSRAIRPAEARTSPEIVRSRVVLPAPLAPSTAVIRPLSAVKPTPRSAVTGP